MKKLFYREDAKSAKNGFKSVFGKSFLRGLRVFAVNPLFCLFLILPLLQGCSLLFVQKGETRQLDKPLEKAPQADSQSKALSATPVLAYEVKEGDTLEAISVWYFGGTQKTGKIARDNKLAQGQKLREGMVLRIVDPVYFPDPKDLGKKAVGKRTATYIATALRTTTPTPALKKNPSVPATAKPSQTLTKTPTPIVMPKDLARIPRPVVNRAFAAGEKLRYEARALGTLGAYASMEVTKSVMVAGRPCYPIVIRANSVFPISAVFPVNDMQTSYFDAVDFLSWKFDNSVHEGNYKARHKETYDQVRHKVTRIRNDDKPEETDIQPFSQDIISWLYYFRLLPIEAGKTYLVPIQSRGKNHQLLLSVLKKERIEVPAGTFDCFKVKIVIKSGTAFRIDEGDIHFWVTDDPRHIVVKTKFALFLGSVDIDLLEATLPQLPK